jgi:hypothetical protein
MAMMPGKLSATSTQVDPFALWVLMRHWARRRS